MKPDLLARLKAYCRDDDAFAHLVKFLGDEIGIYDLATDPFSPDMDAARDPLWQHIEDVKVNPVFQTFPGMVFVARPTGRGRLMVYLSDDCVNLTGYAPTELLGNRAHAFDAIICPDDRSAVLAAIHADLARQREYGVEYCICTQTGQHRWLWEKGIGLFDSQDRLIGMQGFITDITYRKGVEKALSLSQERYALAVSAGKVGVWDWNLAQDTLYVDPILKGMLGYIDAHELTTILDWLNLIHPEDTLTFVHAIREFLTGRCGELAIEHRVYHQDGSLRWFQTYGTLTRSNDGLPERLVCMGVDITAQHQAELQIQQQAESLKAALETSRLMDAIATRIRQSLDLDEILLMTVAEVRQFLRTDRVMIYHLASPNEGVLVAESTAPEWQLVGPIRTHHEHWIHTQVVDSPTHPLTPSTQDSPIQDSQSELQHLQQGIAQVVHSFNTQHYDPISAGILNQMHIRSKLVLPIVQGADLWGLLVVHQCSHERHWQDLDIDSLAKLTNQVAIALQQAQLFQELHQRAQREEFLNRISSILTSSLTPQHILHEIVKETGQQLGVERAYLFSLGNSQVDILAEWLATEAIPSIHHQPNLDRILPSFIDHPFYSDQRPVVTHTATTTPPASTHTDKPDPSPEPNSLLSVPVFIHHKPFGALVLENLSNQRIFSNHEIGLIQQIADKIEIALHNAQSYEYLEWIVQQRTRELEDQKRLSETANQAKSQFLAVMSHELRTPLSSILGLSNLLSQEMFGALNQRQREYINCIQSSGEHLLALIGDILDLTKVEAGKETLVFSKVSVSEICQYCLSMVREKALEKGLMLNYNLNPQLRNCIADERRLRQMLLNLLSNAIKFTPSGTVSLSATSDEQGITFAIQDTGIGIAETDLAQLFEPFYQVDSQLNRHYEGTGLGLALTKQLARLHGGEIIVESTLGVGSTFKLLIPWVPYSKIDGDPNHPFHPSHSALTAQTEEPHPHSTALPEAKNFLQSTHSTPETRDDKRILLVEQDTRSAVLLKDYLEICGYEVLHLVSGTGLLERVKQFQPQLILMDIHLGHDHEGYDFLTTLQAQPLGQSIPVVLVTGRDRSTLPALDLKSNVADYLHKPIDIPHLELVLSKYL